MTCNCIEKCMKGCRWCPIILVIIGGGLFALGWYLPVEITRILWLISSGLIAFFGLCMLLMMQTMGRK